MTTYDNDSAEFFRARGFGLRIGFGARPALLVIDLINGFTDATMPLGSGLDAEIVHTRALLDAGRAASVPILHTVVRYDEEDLADAGVWRRKQAGAASLVAGTRAVELDERLERRPNEQVVVKKYASAFFGTDLTSRLLSAGVDTLLIAGCTTSGCVRASAVDAVQLGFRPMVVREAVGDRSAAAHDQALFDLDQKYADVVSAEDARRYLGELTAGG
ncbi:isochorismatase family protein [Conexibacter sp. CPCC 206217]|uniref:isochorismatase family protein n=1 Tax=Conexibacter sp. CPCC 206217 TaxID=3064574 RepID=UPI00271F016E|nr:isochorismatase family protein [Conexibacter sp. CPCC 206217]MDO8212075.1 isochorismatase family protein [Conexibacter sp. CPCC 206217]